jgi:hypothetical protein
MPELKFTNLRTALIPLYSYNGSAMKPRHYKIDTGATYTTTNKESLDYWGYDESWIKNGRLLKGKERPYLADGRPVDNCYLVRIPAIYIGKWKGENWPFIVSYDDKAQFNLLFGTDSLWFFDWKFNFSSGTFSYEAVPNRVKKPENQKKQALFAISEAEDYTAHVKTNELTPQEKQLLIYAQSASKIKIQDSGGLTLVNTKLPSPEELQQILTRLEEIGHISKYDGGYRLTEQGRMYLSEIGY